MSWNSLIITKQHGQAIIHPLFLCRVVVSFWCCLGGQIHFSVKSSFLRPSSFMELSYNFRLSLFLELSSFLKLSSFWGCLNFWCSLYYWGYLRFWGCLQFEVIINFEVVFSIYSIRRSNLLFTASKKKTSWDWAMSSSS